MTTINQLSQATSVSDGDTIPLYQPSQADTRSVSLIQIAAYVQASFDPDTYETQYSAIASGSIFAFLVQPSVIGKSVWAQLRPPVAATSATVTLPSSDYRSDGQEVLVTCTQPITALTVAGNGASVLGAPSSLSSNGFFRLRYDSISTTWFRVG